MVVLPAARSRDDTVHRPGVLPGSAGGSRRVRSAGAVGGQDGTSRGPGGPAATGDLRGAEGGEVIRRASEAMERIGGVSRWFIAGHSRGGAVAARCVKQGAHVAAGLILVGTSHPRDYSLADATVPVTKILGTRDGVAEVELSGLNRHLLPASTRWVLIEGGDHSQFGWYGFQPGDRWASVTREQQQKRTLQAILEALESGGDGGMDG